MGAYVLGEINDIGSNGPYSKFRTDARYESNKGGRRTMKDSGRAELDADA